MVNDVTKFNEQNKFNVKLKLWKKKHTFHMRWPNCSHVLSVLFFTCRIYSVNNYKGSENIERQMGQLAEKKEDK